MVDYTKAISLNPQDGLAYIDRGTIYKKLKEYTKAEADYNKAIEIDSQYAAYINQEVIQNSFIIYKFMNK